MPIFCATPGTPVEAGGLTFAIGLRRLLSRAYAIARLPAGTTHIATNSTLSSIGSFALLMRTEGVFKRAIERYRQSLFTFMSERAVSIHH